MPTVRTRSLAMVLGGFGVPLVLALSPMACSGGGPEGGATAAPPSGGGIASDAGGARSDGGISCGKSTAAIKDVVAGSAHTCVLLEDGAVKCWGRDGLNRGLKVDVALGCTLPLGERGKVSALVARRGATCLVLAEGGVLCWGEGAPGRVAAAQDPGAGADAGADAGGSGVGGNDAGLASADGGGAVLPPVDLAALSVKSFAGKIVDVAMGNGFACARFEDGGVSCWGDNSEGQWGVADDGTSKDGSGGGPTAGGGPVDLGAGRKALGIAASSASVAVVLDNGSVRQWGRFGILQIPKPTTYAFGPCAVPDEYPCQGYAPTIKDKVEEISGGFGHFCSRLSDGRIACWKKKPEASPNALSEGEAALAASASSAFDKPADPALARPGEDPRRDVGTARAVVSSDGHSCVVLQSGGLRCWGQNDSGQLGIGSTLKIDGKGDNALLNVPIVTLGAGRTVLRVALGGKHTCALLDDRSLKCWGKNDAEQRGDTDPTNRGDTALSTPDLLRPIAFP